MTAGIDEAKTKRHFDGSNSAANTDMASSTPMNKNGEIALLLLLKTNAPPTTAKLHMVAMNRHRSFNAFSIQQPNLSS